MDNSVAGTKARKSINTKEHNNSFFYKADGSYNGFFKWVPLQCITPAG